MLKELLKSNVMELRIWPECTKIPPTKQECQERRIHFVNLRRIYKITICKGPTTIFNHHKKNIKILKIQHALFKRERFSQIVNAHSLLHFV